MCLRHASARGQASINGIQTSFPKSPKRDTADILLVALGMSLIKANKSRFRCLVRLIDLAQNRETQFTACV